GHGVGQQVAAEREQGQLVDQAAGRADEDREQHEEACRARRGRAPGGGSGRAGQEMAAATPRATATGAEALIPAPRCRSEWVNTAPSLPGVSRSMATKESPISSSPSTP